MNVQFFGVTVVVGYTSVTNKTATTAARTWREKAELCGDVGEGSVCDGVGLALGVAETEPVGVAEPVALVAVGEDVGVGATPMKSELTLSVHAAQFDDTMKFVVEGRTRPPLAISAFRFAAAAFVVESESVCRSNPKLTPFPDDCRRTTGHDPPFAIA